MDTIMHKLHFIKNFVTDYKVGAFFQSSPQLIARALVSLPPNPHFIIEQGPGDGVMTRVLLHKLAPTGKLILIEQNKEFIKNLRALNDPRITIVEGFAQDFDYASHLKKGELADAIISSIPFSFLEKKDREHICRDAYIHLAPRGSFIIFHQYSTLMLNSMKKYFREAHASFVLQNIFPCFVLSATKEESATVSNDTAIDAPQVQ